MGFKKSLLTGIAVCIATTVAARKASGGRLGTKAGLLVGALVAVGTWLSGGGDETEVEIEYEATAE